MSYSIYDSTIPIVSHALDSLVSILNKAEAHAQEKDIPASDLLNARLYEDMLPLAFQVHVATDTASKGVHRVHGTEPEELNFQDIKTFDDCRARIAKAVDLIKTAEPATWVARAEATINVGVGRGISADFLVKDYLVAYTLPNVFFHLQTAYAILRSKGVPLGKQDYLASFMKPYMKAPPS